MLKRVSRKTSQGLPELEVFAKLEAPCANEVDRAVGSGRVTVAAGESFGVEMRAALTVEAKRKALRFRDELHVDSRAHVS